MAANLNLSAAAFAPSVRSGRISVKEYYSQVRARFEQVKFHNILPGGGTAPATMGGPAMGEGAAPLKGALAGVPFVVSPDIDVAGAATHAGNEVLSCAVAEADAPSVAALRGRGAHLLGQTTGSDLSLAVAGSSLAKNPFTQFGLAGGSVAAAVAARVATVGLVVDLLGNARAAAALSGCTAFRPTHGRYQRGGTLSISPTLGTLAVIGRTVRDLQLLDAVLGSASAQAAMAAVAGPSAAEGGSGEEAEGNAAAPTAGGPGLDEKEAAALKMQALSRGFVSRRRVLNAKATGDTSRLPGGVGKGPGGGMARGGGGAFPSASSLATPTKASARHTSERFAAQLAGTEARLDALEAEAGSDSAAGGSTGGGGGAGVLPPTASVEGSAGGGGGPVAHQPPPPPPPPPPRRPSAPARPPRRGPRGVFSAELEGLRIGVPRSSPLFALLHPALMPVVEAALSRLAKAGVVLVEVELEGGSAETADLQAAAQEAANTLLAYEAPREIAGYTLTRSAPIPAPPKKPAGEGEEEEVEEEAPAEGEEGSKPKGPPPLVPLDTLIAPSKVLLAYKGPAHLGALLGAQVNWKTAVSATAYRGALVYARPAIKRGFTTVFKRHNLAAIVYPATLMAPAPTKGEGGLLVDSNGEAVDATSAYTANLLMASVAGLPAVVVPCGLTKPRPGAPAGTPDAERLPVALEFMGLPEKDDKLLAIAAAFQRLAPMLADPIVVAAFKTGVGRDMTS